MGLLFVFFPEEKSAAASASSAITTSNAIVGKGTPYSPLCSGSSSSSKTIKRINFNSPILIKTQSTISICVLLLFLTILLFTLSTFEPTIPNPTTAIKAPRRFLSDNPPNTFINTHQTKSKLSWFYSIWTGRYQPRNGKNSEFLSSFALQGMGKLYRRGTRAMSDLVVAHVVEDTNEDEFRLFLRVLHRSGLTARADLVFLFGSSSCESRFEGLIREENDSFLRLVQHYKKANYTASHDSVSVPASTFDVTQFVKRERKEMWEPLWGKRTRLNNYNDSKGSEGELTQLSYGSVVAFEASELDPENALAGFLDHVPMSLRRWACFPMLLGRVRRNFKHIMLVNSKMLLLLSDPLGRFRNQSPESVYISTKQETTSSAKHGKRSSNSSAKTQTHSQVNSAIMMGGTRGIRRFSNAMLTEIVRVAMKHKGKSVSESAIMSALVGNGHILKNIDMRKMSESTQEARELSESNSAGGCDNCRIIQLGNDINSRIMKQICSSEVGSAVYRDCWLSNQTKK